MRKLAAIFCVTTLLAGCGDEGEELSEEDKELNATCAQAEELAADGLHGKAVALLRQAYREMNENSLIEIRRNVLFGLVAGLDQITNGDEAMQYARELLALVDDEESRARAMRSMGLAHDAQGNREEAISAYAAAIKIYLKVKDQEGLAACYNRLGLIYRLQNDDEKAIWYFEQSLDINLKRLGPEHLLVGATYFDIGVIHRNKDLGKGNLEAAKFFEKALAIYSKALGPEHPDTKNTERMLVLAKRGLILP